MQFSIRDVLWLMTVAALVLALIYTKRPLSVPVPPPPVAVGRYQLMSDPKSGNVFLLDTATGRAWTYYSPQQWSDTKSPAANEKAP